MLLSSNISLPELIKFKIDMLELHTSILKHRHFFTTEVRDYCWDSITETVIKVDFLIQKKMELK